MITWWLTGSKSYTAPYEMTTNNLKSQIESLQVPGSHAAASSQQDILTLSSNVSRRDRSNSVRSNLSVKATVFQRAGSFRQKVKTASLSPSHISLDNVPTRNDSGEASYLLSNKNSNNNSFTSQHSSNSIVINVNHIS